MYAPRNTCVWSWTARRRRPGRGGTRSSTPRWWSTRSQRARCAPSARWTASSPLWTWPITVAILTSDLFRPLNLIRRSNYANCSWHTKLFQATQQLYPATCWIRQWLVWTCLYRGIKYPTFKNYNDNEGSLNRAAMSKVLFIATACAPRGGDKLVRHVPSLTQLKTWFSLFHYQERGARHAYNAAFTCSQTASKEVSGQDDVSHAAVIATRASQKSGFCYGSQGTCSASGSEC